MHDYLREMLRLQERWASAFIPIQERFFAPGYRLYEPDKNVQTAKNETVVSVTEVGRQVEVITTGYGDQHRLRYSLEACGDAFRIARVELECSLCSRRGKTKPNCVFCGGKGWKGLPFKSRV